MICFKLILPQIVLRLSSRQYASSKSGSSKMLKKKPPTTTTGKQMVVEKKVLPVETDPERLVNYCCGSNIYIEGEDVKLKPDNEYPDWLWNLHTGKPPQLNELDPNTRKYWMKVRKMGMKQANKMRSLRKF